MARVRVALTGAAVVVVGVRVVVVVVVVVVVGVNVVVVVVVVVVVGNGVPDIAKSSDLGHRNCYTGGCRDNRPGKRNNHNTACFDHGLWWRPWRGRGRIGHTLLDDAKRRPTRINRWWGSSPLVWTPLNSAIWSPLASTRNTSHCQPPFG